MRRLIVFSALTVLAAPACGPAVDLTHGVRVESVSTGWFDAGRVHGKTRLVPTVSFRLKNLSDRRLTMLQVNAVFRRVNERDEWSSGFLTVAGSDGLAPGTVSPTLTIRAQLGYTGTDPRDDLLRNSQFVDASVDLFAKYASNQWTRLGEYPVARQVVDTQVAFHH
jgi:hypothetical protein